jgi:hypothetical protein
MSDHENDHLQIPHDPELAAAINCRAEPSLRELLREARENRLEIRAGLTTTGVFDTCQHSAQDL